MSIKMKTNELYRQLMNELKALGKPISVQVGEVLVESSKNTLGEVEKSVNRLVERHSDYLTHKKLKRDLTGFG